MKILNSHLMGIVVINFQIVLKKCEETNKTTIITPDVRKGFGTN